MSAFTVMKKRWEVVYTHRSAYEGLGPDGGEKPWDQEGRSEHRTWFGADFYRRFRFRPMTLGFRWVETSILPAGTPHEPGDSPPDGEPRWAEHLERGVWRPLYWLRNRWDGLRYGLNRDRREW